MKKQTYKIISIMVLVCMLLSSVVSVSAATAGDKDAGPIASVGKTIESKAKEASEKGDKKTKKESRSAKLEELMALLEKAHGLNEDDYTPESWAQFKEVRDSIADPSQIPEQYLQQVINMVQGAMDKLVKKQSKLDELVALLEKAHGLNEDDYTPESWAQFKEVRDSIVDPSQIPEQYLQQVINMVQGAMDKLVKKQSKLEELKALIAQADKLVEAEYTAESWQAFKAVRDGIGDPDAIPQAYIPFVLLSLQNAMANLEKAGTPGGPQLADGYYFATLNSIGPPPNVQSSSGEFFRGHEMHDAALIKAEGGKYRVTMKVPRSEDVPYFGILGVPYKEGEDYVGKTGAAGWKAGYSVQSSQFSAKVKEGAVAENDKYWKPHVREEKEDGSAILTFTVDDLGQEMHLMYATTRTMQGRHLSINTRTTMRIDLEGMKQEEGIDIRFRDSDAESAKRWGLTGATARWKEGKEELVVSVDLDQALAEKHKLKIKDHKGEILPVINGKPTLSIKAKTYEDMAFGAYLRYEYTYTMINGEGEASAERVINLMPLPGKREVVSAEDGRTGTKLVTDNTILPRGVKLRAKDIVDDPNSQDDPYSFINRALPPYKNMYMYDWEVEYPDGKATSVLPRPVKMKFKLPDGWDPDRTKVFWVKTGKNNTTNGWTNRVKSVVEKTPEGNYLVVETGVLWNFAIFEMPQIGEDAGPMEDGTYKVPTYVYHLTEEGNTSMADRCLGGETKVVVKGDKKTMYFDYKGITHLDIFGYMSRMWIYGKDMTMAGGSPTGSKDPVTFTSYYMNGDGSYLTDDYNAGTLNYYPKAGYVQLPNDKGRWPARFKVPIMDLIGGGNFEQDAWLTMDWKNAEKISDETPEPPIKKALQEQLKIGQTAVKEDYTEKSFAAFEKAFSKADRVNGDPQATFAQMKEAHDELRDAINGLVKMKTVQLEEGLYTAKGSIEKEGDIPDARVVVTGETSEIYLRGPLLSLRYYDVEKKQYFPAKEIKEMVDGQMERVGFSFPFPGVTDTIAVKYAFAGGGHHSGTLKLSHFEKQAIDKDQLKEYLDQANEKLEDAAANPGNYDPQLIAQLQSQVAESTPVYVNKAALQQEIDKETQALKHALDALSGQNNLAQLKKAVEKAEKVNGEGYTPASFAILTSEIAASKALLEKEGVTAAELDAQLIKLNAAILGLIPIADKTELNQVYQEAVAIPNAGYPGWENLQQVLTSAKKVIDDPNASQAQVDQQITAIRKAVKNLNGGVDKTVLQELIIQAEALDLSAYTPASVKSFQEVIAAAKAVYDDESASQQEVDKQIQLLEAGSKALIQKQEENTVYDGIYTIDGKMWHAVSDQASMGNAALKKPLQLVVKDGKAHLRMEYVPLTLNMGATQFTGYLGFLNHFPGWEGGPNGWEPPSGQTPVAASVEEYYAKVYDVYNHPETGTDKLMKGKEYPHFVTMPVDLGQEKLWIQVYVPVMEAISQGSGKQYAKILLDWNTLKQVSGVSTNKEKLIRTIEKAEALEKGLTEETPGYSLANQTMLRGAIAAGKDVKDNLNVDQKAVDATVVLLEKAMNVFTKEEVETDKSALLQGIHRAAGYLEGNEGSYTEDSLSILRNAVDRGREVYANEEATQTEVNAALAAINDAIQSLVRIGADKEELKTALKETKAYLKDKENYSAAALEALQSLYDRAEEVYKDQDADQEAVDAQVRILKFAVKQLEKTQQPKPDTLGLHNMLMVAANMAGRDHLYTEESINNLKNAIAKAQKVYENKDATQEEINEEAARLSMAILALEAKPASPNPGGGNGNGNGGNGGNEALDPNDLKDGVYSVQGEMIKIDKRTHSMANEAINHTIKLTVKKGKPYITMDFKGLAFAGQFGYLSTLKYFDTGYTLDQYGAPKGAVKKTKVETYQKSSDGKKVKDSFGTDYPDLVTFPMIPEAFTDGYVPLQVFVPIMEAISAGAGTQPVFLRLDWSTLKKTSADDDAFNDNGGNNNQQGGNGNSNGGPLTNNLPGGSTLSPTSSLTPRPSALSGSGIKPGSGLKGATGLKPGGVGLTAGNTALNAEKADGVDPGTRLKASSLGERSMSKAIIPIIMSLLALIGGVIYKIRSRNWVLG